MTAALTVATRVSGLCLLAFFFHIHIIVSIVTADTQGLAFWAFHVIQI